MAEQGTEGRHEMQEPPIDFVTLGMFIIDDIDFAPPTPPARDVPGGAGTFSALGARMFSPHQLSKSVGWIVDQGAHFPPALTALIESWDMSTVFRLDPTRSTTRGWNGYDESGHRSFKYATPKKRLTAADLPPPFVQAKAYHLICSPLRCRELVTEITSMRKQITPSEHFQKPIFIWEPVPDLCKPDELLNCTNTLPMVDICSPNHSELAGFMGDDGINHATGTISKAAIEGFCEQLLASMPLQSYTLVVRAGEKGCYLARNGGRRRAQRSEASSAKRRKKEYTSSRGGLRHDTDMEALFAGLLQDADGSIAREEIEVDPGLDKWIPAFHQSATKVVDPTGGGNCFLGGLAIALARGKSIEEAAIWGTVAASFAIEQVGVPILGKNNEGCETWNGSTVAERVAYMEGRELPEA